MLRLKVAAAVFTCQISSLSLSLSLCFDRQHLRAPHTSLFTHEHTCTHAHAQSVQEQQRSNQRRGGYMQWWWRRWANFDSFNSPAATSTDVLQRRLRIAAAVLFRCFHSRPISVVLKKRKKEEKKKKTNGSTYLKE